MQSQERLLPDWLNVSRETVAKLGAFLDLVEKWNPKINLVSGNSVATAWSRHVLDSAQLWELARPSTGIWLDIGSGGGFPGLVISILAEESCPDLRVMLVESDRRKAVFLSEVVRQLQLTAELHCARVETLAPVGAQIISARAFAALEGLLPLVSRHMAPGGIAVLPKGQRYEAELIRCRAEWAMECEVIASKTDSDGAVLRIRDLHHV